MSLTYACISAVLGFWRSASETEGFQPLTCPDIIINNLRLQPCYSGWTSGVGRHLFEFYFVKSDREKPQRWALNKHQKKHSWAGSPLLKLMTGKQAASSALTAASSSLNASNAIVKNHTTVSLAESDVIPRYNIRVFAWYATCLFDRFWMLHQAFFRWTH